MLDLFKIAVGHILSEKKKRKKKIFPTMVKQGKIKQLLKAIQASQKLSKSVKNRNKLDTINPKYYRITMGSKLVTLKIIKSERNFSAHF